MVNFNFSFDPGTSLQQMIGFETAGRIWSSYLTDPITVNLQVGVSSSLGSNVIGGALPAINAKQSYSSFTSALKADATSTDDQMALKQVFGSSFSATYKLSALGLTTQWTGTSSSINLTRADAKALGLSVSGDSNSLDGYILFGSLSGTPVQWNYDYTRSAPAPTNSLDFLSTALHEIGHTLGFVSGLDSPGWIDSNFGWNTSAMLSAASQLNAITTGATPLDLFRYSTNLLNLADTRDLSSGGTKVFALGGFSTPIANFSTGTDTTQGGNGYEASHWSLGTNSIEAPTLKTGTRSSIAAIDLRALDVIGWNVVPGGINTTLNLSALQAQSKQSLATRLGQTVSWLDANSTTAAQSLAQNRSQDVYTMIEQSQVYNLNRITPPTPGAPLSLTYEQLFQEQGLFETIDELVVLPVVSIQPSLTLSGDVTTNLNRPTPPTPGSTTSLNLDLAAPNLNRPTPPTPGSTTSLTLDLAAPNLNRPTPPTPSVSPTAIVSLFGNADTLIGTVDHYFYGSSKPVAYEGTQTTQEPFAPLTVLVDLSAAL